jgi:hypothetical protein
MVSPGRAWWVSPSTWISAVPGASVLNLLVTLPVGGELNLADGTTLQPPWSA